MDEPSPIGRGLEPPGAKRSARRKGVGRVATFGEAVSLFGAAASPRDRADPHPALRATFSQREKDRVIEPAREHVGVSQR